MKLIVTDRQSIEQGLVVRSSFAVISIRDPGVKRARIPKTTALQGVLHLAFHDAEPTETFRLPPEIKPMTQAHAKQIWRFVDQYKAQVGAFVVHCHQGMSRSPTVAAAVAVYLGLDEQRFWRKYMLNQHVYQVMRETMPGVGE